MLNPELERKYGEKSLIFFNKFVGSIGTDLAEKCYALSNSAVITSRDLVAPEYIGVLTDDKSEVDKAFLVGVRTSFELREEYDERDDAVRCRMCDIDRATKEGIKIWVG